MALIENPTATRFAQTNDVINDPHADGHQYAAVLVLPGQLSGWASAPLAATVQPSTTYTLTVAVGHALDVPSTDYHLFLLGGSTGLASQDITGTSIAPGTFQDLTLTYTSPASGSVIGTNFVIGVRATNNGNVFAEGIFDNVRFDPVSAVSTPEPAGAAVFIMLGSICVLRRRRRR